MELTKDEKIKEYIRCRKDPVYFTNHYCYIAHPMEGVIPFKTYPFQDKIINDYVNHRFNITNKSRQTGLSTVTASFALWEAIFNNNANIVIVSIKDKDAQNFLKKIKVAFRKLPEWMKGGKPTLDNAHELVLQNESTIMSVASGSEAARGEALTRLIIDEAAFINNIESIWTSSYPTLSRGGSAILISTPNGVGNFFYNQWTKTQLNEGDLEEDLDVGFNSNFVHWTQIPEYRCFDDTTGMTFDEIVEKAKTGKWYRSTHANINKRKWAQEFEGDFLGSGNTLIDNDILKKIQLGGELKDPEFRYDAEFNESPTGGLWVWKKPEKDRMYLIAADISSGDGADYSATQVMDVFTGEQVAEYRGKCDLSKYADFLIELSTWYNEGMLIPEITGIGYGLVHMLVYEKNYMNIFQSRNEETQKLQKRKYGWYTTVKTRPLLLTYLESSVNAMEYKWYSKRLWNELSTFVWKTNGKCEAETGCNDDLAMAYSIATYCRQSAMLGIPLEMANEMAAAQGKPLTIEAPKLETKNIKTADVPEQDKPMGLFGKYEQEMDTTWLKK